MQNMSKKQVDDYLNEISYSPDPDYIPTEFALDMINFIKLVNGGRGEENKSPVTHLRLLDSFVKKGDVTNLCHRGFAKTTLIEYLIEYIGVYGKLPGFGNVTYMLYVSDSMDNGVKSMKDSLESRYNNSEFLQEYIPQAKFTENYWKFTNKEGHTFVVNGYGANTGIRGTKKQGVRPQIAVLDDLLSDKDAKSKAVLEDIENTVYKAVTHALHPTHHKIIWCGTPFNKRDPLYKAVESGAWVVNVYPVCEKFPCTREEFKGSWEDRFTYDYVKSKYDTAMATGTIQAFNQELMLRIMSDEDRLINLNEIQWFSLKDLMKNKNSFNYYITTDFAVSDKESADYSCISVWAYSNNGDLYWVDGTVKRQTIDKSIEDLFIFNTLYNPVQVGIEVTGQQGGFIDIIQRECLRRNQFINLAREKGATKAGIRPNTNKFIRFNSIVPWFKLHKFYFPEELREDPRMMEAVEEITLVSPSGFLSRHDDFLDTISMLSKLNLWKPSVETKVHLESNNVYSINRFDEDINDESGYSSYIV